MKLLASFFATSFLTVCLMCQSCNESQTGNSRIDSLTLVDSISSDTVQLVQSDSTVEVVSTIDTTFIGYFSEFPPEIDGCTVIYSTDQQHFNRSRFIYMSNFDSLAFMKIDGVMIKFVLTATEYPDSKTWIYHFSGQGYNLTVEEKSRERIGDEVWSNYGTLILTDKTGKSLTIKFIGESGC